MRPVGHGSVLQALHIYSCIAPLDDATDIPVQPFNLIAGADADTVFAEKIISGKRILNANFAAAFAYK